jgi:hypothetical protein
LEVMWSSKFWYDIWLTLAFATSPIICFEYNGSQ